MASLNELDLIMRDKPCTLPKTTMKTRIRICLSLLATLLIGTGLALHFSKSQSTEQPGERQALLPVSAGLAFEDFKAQYTSSEDFRPYRAFSIAADNKAPIKLLSANLNDPGWNEIRDSDQDLITWLHDDNSDFVEEAAYDLPLSGDWQRIRVHIGYFSQDACAKPLLVYSFRKKDIFAIVRLKPEESKLSASKCKLMWRNSEKNIGSFCQERTKCLKTYFDQAKNRLALIPAWLEQISAVRLKLPK